MKWYTGTQADCQAYHDALHGAGVLPITDGAYRMEKWAEGPLECTAGGYCYPQPPQALLDHHGISAGMQGTIRANYVEGKLTIVDARPECVGDDEGIE